MSTSRKERCRKSKLVPRLCDETEEENVEKVQAAPSLLSKKLKMQDFSEVKFETVKKPPPKFNIDIEVEKFDEDIIIFDDDTDQKDSTHITSACSSTEHLKNEIMLEKKINQTFQKAFNNLMRDSSAPVENGLQKTIRDMMSESNEDKDESLYRIFSLSNVSATNVQNKNQTSSTNENVDNGPRDKVKNDDTDDTVSPLYKIFSLSKRKKNPKSQAVSAIKIDDNAAAIQVENVCPVSLVPEETKVFVYDHNIIYNPNILNELSTIYDTTQNVADKILTVEVRNSFGCSTIVNIEESLTEDMLQNALLKWRNWKMSSKWRSVPVWYTCCICGTAFWHLDPFREHIKTHITVYVDFENSQFESCIKAYSENSKGRKDFKIESDCYRCGKGYDMHPSLHVPAKTYVCPWCSLQFQTCSSFSYHEGICLEFVENLMKHNPNAKSYQCSICELIVWKEEELTQHLERYHTVRSDLPTVVRTRWCKKCSQKYVYSSTHKCSQSENGSVSCTHYNKQFRLLETLKAHLHSPKDDQCPICNTTLTKRCVLAEHIIRAGHSRKFDIVYTNNICNQLFQTKDDIIRHNLEKHAKGNHNFRNYFNFIIVLKETLGKCELVKNNQSCEFVKTLQIAPDRTLSNLPEEYEACTSDSNEASNEPVDAKGNNSNIVYIREPTRSKQSIDIEDSTNSNDNTDVWNKHNEIVKEEFEATDDNFIIKQEIDTNNDYSPIEVKVETDSNEFDKTSTKLNVSLTVEVKNEPEEFFDEDIIVLNKDAGTSETEIMYDCKNCGITVQHKDYLEHIGKCIDDHMVGTHSFICTKCEPAATLKSKNKYLIHLVRVHELKMFMCPQCKQIFSDNIVLFTHLTTHINNQFKIITNQKNGVAKKCGVQKICKDCSSVVDVADMFKHWESHLVLPERNVEMDDKTYDLKMDHRENCFHGKLDDESKKVLIQFLTSNLKETARSLFSLSVGRSESRRCPQCGRQFARYVDAKRHAVEHLLADAYAAHAARRGLRCQLCDELCHTRDRYRHHMRNHGDLPIYSCRICHRNFSDCSNYTKHKKKHDDTISICDVCGKRYSSKSSLMKHIEKYKNIQCVCPVCGKNCHGLSQLKKHYTKHTRNENYFLCPMCRRRFTSIKDKMDHLWEHHKWRKYEANCPKCDEQFRSFLGMKRHVKAVHGENLHNYKMKLTEPYPDLTID